MDPFCTKLILQVFTRISEEHEPDGTKKEEKLKNSREKIGEKNFL